MPFSIDFLFPYFYQVDEGINCEIVRSVLMERANCPYLASQTAAEVRNHFALKPSDSPFVLNALWIKKYIQLYMLHIYNLECAQYLAEILLKHHGFLVMCGNLQMEAFSRTEDFPKIVEAYSRPARIIRGKQIESAWEVLAVFT
jgi:hypothetical protein